MTKIKIIFLILLGMIGILSLYLLFYNFRFNGLDSGILTIFATAGGLILFKQIKRMSKIFQTVFLSTLALFFGLMTIIFLSPQNININDSFGYFYILGTVIPLIILIKPSTDKKFKDYFLNIIRGILFSIAVISFLGFMAGDFRL